MLLDPQAVLVDLVVPFRSECISLVSQRSDDFPHPASATQ
jgi:hypothetical protein